MRKLLASLGLVVFVLSACATSPPEKAATPGDSLQVLLDAMQKTNDAGSARMAIDVTFTSPEQTVHVTGDVEYVMDPADPTSLRERIVLDIPSLGMLPGGKVEMIVGKGSVIYVQAPMLASMIPATTPWIKLDPSELPEYDDALAEAAAAGNPAVILDAIKDALTVEEIGADTVDGAGVTHYRATVDIVKLLPLLAELTNEGPTAAEMQEAKDQLRKVGLEHFPVELWVDEEGFLKQARVALDLSSVDPELAGTSFSLTFTFSDVGEPISIDVPPASQVTDITELLRGAFPDGTFPTPSTSAA